MIATTNTTTRNDNLSTIDAAIDHIAPISSMKQVQKRSSVLLQKRIAMHHPKAGLNPLVDAAAYLFSIMGKLKQTNSYHPLSKLQHELIQEINIFQETIKHHGYQAEYMVVCRYILCATLDEIIINSVIGSEGQWEGYSLLAAFNQDTQHQDKFFSIMERAIKEPAIYIDLMELMYLCLSMGYKGQYRATEHNQYQLELITNNLYKHIRTYRGAPSKTLSPAPLKAHPVKTSSRFQKKSSLIVAFFVTGCVIMALFVSFCYLMDVISNEAYQHILPIQNTATHNTIA